MKKQWHSTLSISLFSVMLSWSQLSFADQTVEKTFDVKAGADLVVDTDIGSIHVETHSSSQITAKIEIEGLDDDEFSVRFNPSNGGLRIDGDKQSSDWGWGSRRVKFSLVVPKEFNVQLETAGGSISIDDLQGNVDVRTSGGSLTFGNIIGNIDGRTSGGSISVDGAEGDVRVRTSGGSLSLGDIKGTLHGRTSGGSISLGLVTGPADVATSGGSIRIKNAGGEVKARTSGGSVDVTFTQQPKGNSDISTSGGSITARLSKDIAVNLYARGRKVYSDFPVNGETEAKYKLRGPINGGGPELELQTSSGSVYIKED
ncbi:DUF4097 family beta strand repeat-containing protein [Pleionea litopenaei]|uniref:DUF4097 family beta strand repeat-containing protein n=1 Tax=Pleionea litopenaei TaxID=3070815 RepID=A0AA51RQJ1_9GAMM|nr:DUF4097 family beta strand repeat-containing protein [Pleionea sp. HL-JVS1]WMS85697.1 DUF4097 family beta strand repeat-containing protein [Pleionea sp. HL-JVS1]